MSNLVIVAIPDENDRVWKISSEKVPHLTVLFLGDVDNVSNLDQIIKFVEHAATHTLQRFHLPVDHRGELGADQADVLFFKKDRYDYKAVRDFRAALLQDDNIRTAYDNATQFEGPWNPHLTLGYPAQPAKPDDEGFGIYDVGFNKIAVWTSDFDGPEFLLKDYWDEYEALETVPMSVAMSELEHNGNKKQIIKPPDEEAMAQSTNELGKAFALEHFGVKGMRWGVRKERPTAVAPTATSFVPHGKKRKTKIKTEGGEHHPASDDAIKVAESRAKLSRSGTAALSNQELRDVANRLQLEAQVATLTSSRGRKFVMRELETGSQQLVKRGVRSGVKSGAKNVSKKKLKKAAATAAVTALI